MHYSALQSWLLRRYGYGHRHIYSIYSVYMSMVTVALIKVSSLSPRLGKHCDLLQSVTIAWICYM